MSSPAGFTAASGTDPAVSPGLEVDPFADTVKVLTIRPRSEMDKRNAEVTETFDEASGVRIFKVPGLSVLALSDGVTFEGLMRVAQAAKSRPSELVAIAFHSPPLLEVRNRVSALGFLVAECEAESPNAAARRYAEEFSKRVREGVQSLERFSAEMAKAQG